MLFVSAIAAFFILDTSAWRELQRSVVAAGPHVHVDQIEDLQFTESDESAFLYNTITGAPESARRAWLHSHFFGRKNAVWYLTPRNDTEENREELRSNEWALPLETVAIYHDLYEPDFSPDTDEMRVVRCQVPAHFLTLARDLRDIFQSRFPMEAEAMYKTLSWLAQVPQLLWPQQDIFVGITPSGFGGAMFVLRQNGVAVLYDMTFGLWDTYTESSRLLANGILRQLDRDIVHTAITRVPKNVETIRRYHQSRWHYLGDFDVFFKLNAYN